MYSYHIDIFLQSLLQHLPHITTPGEGYSATFLVLHEGFSMSNPVKINNPFRSPMSEGYQATSSSGGGSSGDSNSDKPSSGGLLSYLGLVGGKPTRKALLTAWLVFIGVLTVTNMIFNASGSGKSRYDGPVYGGLSTTGGLLRDDANASQ